MNEPKLSQRQLVLIRRAAEDAIHACNRHYGPFVDVVAHPLNICALVDMAQMSTVQQAKVDELQTLYTQQGLNMLNLRKQVDATIIQIEKFFDDQRQQPTPREYVNFIANLLEGLKAEQAPTFINSQNKYDWTLIPANVKFMATDEDGMACGWVAEPHIVGNAWRNQSHLSAHFYLTRCRNPFMGDWKESLERRPEDVNPELKVEESK
ncbi:hypothetical protein [Acinetobacter calcoaceticus]|uniref:hypothetical protein n=1 Tax=Acinetobacter calcoaceticus TaxID=471 RepID=UPI001D194DE7|nr:hypothetical protein [Acinetobacter calcoaceticus]